MQYKEHRTDKIFITAKQTDYHSDTQIDDSNFMIELLTKRKANNHHTTHTHT